MATDGTELLDCIVLGGGPAGLQAALTLARVRRSVAVVDAGHARNAAAPHMRNVISRDGTSPDEFRAIAREQLGAYATVRFVEGEAVGAEADGETVAVELEGGQRLRARFLVLATGVDDAPLAFGLDRHWGVQVAQCPFCHGPELGARVVVLGGEPEREHAVRIIAGVAEHVTWLTDGATVEPGVAAALRELRVTIDEREVAGIVEEDGRLTAIALEDGAALACDGVLTGGPWRQASPLPEALGCRLADDGAIEVDGEGRTSVPRVFAAGDAAQSDGHSVIAAAATGQLAAAAIVHSLVA